MYAALIVNEKKKRILTCVTSPQYFVHIMSYYCFEIIVNSYLPSLVKMDLSFMVLSNIISVRPFHFIESDYQVQS